ncbi:RNA-directed DNA polymerase [Peribacillus frigoritolerans]|uniref:RNA-directed DNA polymerase n=1 Tax=Peribacillus frigoritolerans TaxID=450367 RepID=UPI002227BC5F|nr:RNA-directed DNA polymerase [Peribacillus frigoritolerans]UYY97947.1 RNA-directed DNA polymerase [Peribacillus frigoritolerans]
MELTENLTENLVHCVSRKIFNYFFYNRKYFGRQVVGEDGRVVYVRKRNKMSAAILENMINSKKSIMSYQQVRQKLKWVCLDIDIAKDKIDSDFDFFKNTELRNSLYKVYSETVKVLNKYNIKYVSEFSGNRGIHVWIFLDKEVSKNIGYAIIKKIDEELQINIKNLLGIILTDKYPKNGSAKNNTIGLGVKVPLSFHLKSNRYSYLFKETSEIEQIAVLDNEFLEKQMNILDSIKINSVSELIELLKINEVNEEENYQKQNMVLTDQDVNLEGIIEVLSKSEIFRYLFDKPLAHWSERDRIVLVASLIRIKSINDDNFGVRLLNEFFSSDEESYDADVTNEKLQNLKGLYPPNIKYLEDLYKKECSYCREHGIENIYDLLDLHLELKIELISNDLVNFGKIAQSELNYLLQNDEVPLTFIQDDLKNINDENLKDDIQKIYEKNYSFKNIVSYQYVRKETEIKNRYMYSLAANDRILSTYMSSKLTDYMYGDFSVNSYAYRLNKRNNNYIFENWSKAWLEYVYSIEGIINDGSYDEYYLIKLDIKSFYDSIDHIALREVLLKKIKLNVNPIKENEIFPIIHYLIELSKEITGSDKGVPQGPAYARILAELYLSQVDEVIESYLDEDFESYYRYVDDMFIILRDKTRANEIFQNIQQVLDTLKLDINMENEKFQFGVVKDLKYKVITKSFEKYFVDGVDYIGASDELINNTKKLLNELLTTEFNEVDVKQLPFYLTHLIDKEIFDSRKREIGEMILKSDIGRGSLFKHFYNNILFVDKDLKFELDLLINLQGLARSNLFSALIKNFNKYDKDVLKKIITSYSSKKDLLDYERIELIRLIIFSKIDTSDINFETEDLDIIIDNLKYANDFSLGEELESEILTRFQFKGNLNPLTILEDLDYFLEKAENLKRLDKVVNTFESIINISLSKNLNQSNGQSLVNLVCFLSLYSNIHLEGFKGMWKKVLNLDKNAPVSMNEWYKYKKHIVWQSVEEQNLMMIISDVLNDRALFPEEPVSQREKEFVVYLLLFILDPNSNIKSKIQDVNLDQIKGIIKEKNIEFLKWCIDENTDYFPDLPEVPRLNTYYNKRVVFRKQNKLLVRANAKLKDHIQVNAVLNDSWLNGDEYINFILEIKTNEELMNINDKLRGRDLIYGIKLIYGIFQLINKGHLYNYFEKGTFVNSSEDIHFKYSKYDEKIVVNKMNLFDNTPKRVKQEIMELLSDGDLLEKNKDAYQYSPTNFKSEFIPRNITDEDIINYVNFLGKYLNENLKEGEIDPIKIEKAKLYALKKIIKSSKKNFKEVDFVNAYASLSPHDFDRLIVFENDRTKIKDKLLFELFKGITDRIKFDIFEELNGFFKEIEIAKGRVEKYFSSEPKRLNNIIKDYKKPNIVWIEEKEKNLENVKILYPFEHEDLEIIPSNEVANLDARYALYSDSQFDIIIAIPLQGLISIKEKISMIDNKKVVQLLNSKRNALKSLVCFKESSKKIQKQNNLSENESYHRIWRFLDKFEEQYHEALLKLIAAYEVIDEQMCIEFFKELIEISEEKNVCLLPLKTKEDDNGFNVMVTNIGRDYGFDRNSIYQNKIWEDFRIINDCAVNQEYKSLAFVLDIGISGKQFRTTLHNYLYPSKDKPLSEEYFKIDSESLKDFMKQLDEIIIFSVVHTDVFEENVTKKIQQIYESLKSKMPNLKFRGKKIYKEQSTFSKKLDYKERKLIIKAFEEPRFTDKKLYMSDDTFLKYLNSIEEEKTSNILIARYKSMPKGHLIPLTEKFGVFNYRYDSKK